MTRFAFFACLLAIALFATTLHAAPGDVLFEADFDENADDRFRPVSGSWYFEDGAYRETTDGGGPLWSVAGDAGWTHVALELSMRAMDSIGSMYVALRWRDADNHYEMEYQGRGSGLAINRVEDGERTMLARRADVPDVGGHPRRKDKQEAAKRFRFEAAGPILRIYAGDDLLLQAVDRTFAKGRIALGARGRRAVFDDVEVIEVAKPSADAVALASPRIERTSPIEAFHRGRKEIVRLGFEHDAKRPLENVVARIRLLTLFGFEKPLGAIPAGEAVTVEIPLDTRIVRSGEYTLKAELIQNGVVIAQRFIPLTIVPKPNPERMEVINWTGHLPAGATDPWGFTAFWFDARVHEKYARPDLEPPLKAAEPIAFEQSIAAYNRHVSLGAVSGLFLHNLSARHLDPDNRLKTHTVTLDGAVHGSNNPNSPAFMRWAEAWMEAVMQSYKDLPALKVVNMNSEWDRPLDYSEATVAKYTKRFGEAPPRMTYPVDREAIPEEHRPKNGIIADENPYYRYIRWWWNEGQGFNTFNARMHDIVKKHRPDMLTVSEPVLRLPAMVGKARGCDVAQHWSYAWPGPRSIMLSLDGLVATRKAMGQMISHDVQFLWKAGWAGPRSMAPSADIVRECCWINFSRPQDMTFIWGTHLATQNPHDPEPFYNPQVFRVYRQFARDVIEPFGPMLRRSTSPPKPVAFLQSTASHLFVKGWRWGVGVHSMHFYDLLQKANIPTDVVYEDDIRGGALADRGYKAVVLSYCETLPESVYRRLVEFAKGGGIVIADQYLEADIPGARRIEMDLEFYRRHNYDLVRKGQSDLDRVEAKLDDLAATLRAAFKDAIATPVRTDSPDVLVNTIDAGGHRLITLINDRRTLGEWAGRFRTIRDAGVPQTPTVSVRLSGPEAALYDLLRHRRIDAEADEEGMATFRRPLGPGAGAYIMETPEPIGGVWVDAADPKEKSLPVAVRIVVRGESGNPMPGLLPIEVEVLDAFGVPTEYSCHRVARNGLSMFEFQPARNESGGAWTIRVTDLASGLGAEAVVTVPRDPRRFSGDDPELRRMYSPGEWDRD